MEKSRLRQKLSERLEQLLALSDDYITQDIGAHEIEKGLLAELLSIGLLLLKYIIAQKLKQVQGHVALGQGRNKSKGKKSRQYLSLFGSLSIIRPSYWSSEWGVYYPLDEYLELPRGSYWSYTIQELVGENASENDFRESVRMINQLLGLNLSWKASQRNSYRLGNQVSAYYEQQPIEQEKEAVCFSVSFDGKGVPKIQPKGETKERKMRLGKGEKLGIKQMATVSVSSHFTPKQRSVPAIIQGLMGSEQKLGQVNPSPQIGAIERDNHWHEKIHRRAFLADQDKAVDYGISDIKQRMGHPQSRFVVPIDAGIGLEDKVLASVKKYGLAAQFDGIILDIVHVSEYVWEAATAIFGEQSKLRTPWVRDMLTDLLSSKTEKVIKDLSLIRDKTTLSKSKIVKVQKVITYFTNHQHKMDYQTFIDKGYPVSSALAESTCGHLVKERMEQSGMRWSSLGAQNIMDLRAIKLNGDTEDFLRFVIRTERKVQLQFRTAA